MALGLQGDDYRVTGWDRDSDRNESALEQNVVDDVVAPDRLEDDPFGIVLAVPVPEMPPLVQQITASSVSPSFFTDVGSTKQWVLRQVDEFLSDDIPFIGAHPMAGSEHSGLEAADPLLFENAICVVTTNRRKHESVDEVTKLWDRLGAHVTIMSPLRHDRIASSVSHLPHVAAASLVHAIRQLDSYREDALALAAGGFRDTTRIADGDPDLWKDILQTNRDEVLRVINDYETILSDLKSHLRDEEWSKLEEWLQKAREIRGEIPEKTKGMIGGLHELRIQAPDRPGILSEVTGILAEESINICDIEVLRVREGETGTIKLAFRRRSECENAQSLLRRRGEEIKII